jgi:uncharacterized protein (DUF736 family)
MATIGTFTKSGVHFTDAVKTLALKVKARIARAEKENDKAPDYRIFAGTTQFRRGRRAGIRGALAG